VPAPPRLLAAPDRPAKRYIWLLALVVAVGLGGSLAISFTLYRTAERQWVARADASAERLSTILLGWIEESYSPLSGLAGLVENSKKTQPDEFLNAFEGIESRAASFLLGSAAMLERDEKGNWALSTSSGDFDYLEKDSKDGFTKLLPAIAFAVARPNQFVLAPPVETVDGKLMSPVLIALARVKTPTVLVGRLDYTILQGALTEAPTPKGFYLTLKGKFMDSSDIRTILQIDSSQAVREALATRAATGGADLEIVWRVTKEYEEGPAHGLAAITLGGGITTTLLVSMFMAGLIRRNRIINEKVDQATAALRRSGEEQTAILESATSGIAFVKDGVIVRGNARLDELFGFERGEQIGQLTRIWYPDDVSHAAGGEAVYEQIARGESHQREQRLMRKGRELFWCRLSGRAVDARDLSQGTVWMLEDVTQQKAAEEALQQAHELVRHAFGRYVSEEVAESLLRAPESLELGGEERETTILMSDLRGFTAMASRLTPHEVIEVLNLYLEAMVDVIGRYQGTIDEIIGDAILVIFGAPVSCDDHADRAVACGLAMHLAMRDVNQRLVAKGAAELEMGIGVHTGRVIVGNIGSLRRTKYAAVGSNVNLAGRIESFTVGGQLLISEDTRRNVKAPLRIDKQFQVEPKGAAGSVLLFEIGAIGDPFDLSLPSRSKPLRPLVPPLPIRFTTLEESFPGRTVHEGHLTEVSDLEARVQSPLALAVLSNLKITVSETPQGNPAGDIYGKVLESVAETPGCARIWFTSISPEFKTWLSAATAGGV
jgi:PAS domain S-box-containing protein